MTRLVFFNDPHYSRHAPECRADSYPQEILEKFHDCARIAVKLKADAIGCSGDWFHRKGKVNFSEANDVLTVLRGWRDKGLDVIGILGNHDIAGHSLESLDNRAVGTLVRSQVLQLLDYDPWISPDRKVVVTGTSYFHGCDADDDARLRMYGLPHAVAAKQHEFTTVHVAHGTLVRREFFEEYTRMEDLVVMLHERDRCPDVIVCGHLHFSEGVVKVERPGGGTVTICRVGSLGRVASDDLDRQVNALVLAFKGGRVAAKEVPIGKDPVRTYQDEDGKEHRDPKEHEERIKEFVRVLREEADEESLVDHRALLRTVCTKLGMEFDDDVFNLAAQAVESRQ